MEKLGPSLKDVLDRRASRILSLKTTMQIGIQIIERLELLHNAGCIHLDLKPRNIVLMTDDMTSENRSTLCLIDFGISQIYRYANSRHKIFSTGIAQSGSPFFSSKHAFNGHGKPYF